LEKFRNFESIVKSSPGKYILSITSITSTQKYYGYSQRTLSAIFDVSFYHEDRSDMYVAEFSTELFQPEWTKHLITEKFYDDIFYDCGSFKSKMDYSGYDALDLNYEHREGYFTCSYCHIYLIYPICERMPPDGTKFISIENNAHKVVHYQIENRCTYKLNSEGHKDFVCNEENWPAVWKDAPVIFNTQPMEPTWNVSSSIGSGNDSLEIDYN
jgi:hypothetical protein